VPLWLPLSRRFGKIRLWIFSMLLTGASHIRETILFPQLRDRG